MTATTATLAGSVDAHGSQTSFAFEYGLSNAFGSLSAIDNAGDADGTQSVALPLTGLTPDTSYRYRIVATNANGTSSGAVQNFTTGPPQSPFPARTTRIPFRAEIRAAPTSSVRSSISRIPV